MGVGGMGGGFTEFASHLSGGGVGWGGLRLLAGGVPPPFIFHNKH